jgi:hypothetical protein
MWKRGTPCDPSGKQDGLAEVEVIVWARGGHSSLNPGKLPVRTQGTG